MHIWSRNLLLQAIVPDGLVNIFASEEAILAELGIGNAIKVNDGMATSIYKYTGYPSTTSVTGDFTLNATISDIITINDQIIYKAALEIPTSEANISSDQEDAIITTFGDQNNADVVLNIDQDNVLLTTDTNLETITSTILGYESCLFESLAGYTIRLESGGLNQPTDQQFLVKHGDMIVYALMYNSKIVYYEQLNANTTVTRKRHNLTVNAYNGAVEVLSGFSTSNYIQTSSNWSPSSSPWEIHLDFKTGSSFGSGNTILGSCGTESILYRIKSDGHSFFLLNSTGNAGWNIIGTSTSGSYSYLPNTRYQVNLKFTGTKYICEVKTQNDSSYTTDVEVASATPMVSGLPFRIGNHSYSGGTDTPFSGELYKTNCTYSIDGVLQDLQFTEYGTLTHTTTGGELASDATIKFYDAVSSSGTIQTYSGQVVDYNVSKSGYVTVEGTYTIPKENISGVSYNVNVTLVPESVIPTDYTEVEYIQNIGNSYIETNISAPDGFYCETSFKFDSITSGTLYAVLGAHATSSPYSRNCMYYSSSYIGVGAGGYYLYNQTPSTSAYYDMKFSTVDGDIYLNQDGQVLSPSSTSDVQSTRSALNLRLFNVSGYSGFSSMLGRMKSCSIFINNSLVGNFVPVVRNSDSIAGMYDTVTAQFYRSSSGTDFVAGPSI